MRGSPLLRAAFAFLCLLALAPFLWQMTHRAAAVQQTAPTGAESGKAASGLEKIRIQLAFTTQAKAVSITHLQKVVWTKESPESREECELELPWPKEGGDLIFKVEWPADAPLSAMRVILTDPHESDFERTVWGRASVEKALGFP